jgi:phosphatidate phosphatase APP1
MTKRFYHVEDQKGRRSGFYLSTSPRSLLAALMKKDSMPDCAEGKLFTALRYKITRANVRRLG